MQPIFTVESFGPFARVIGQEGGALIIKHTTAEEAAKLFKTVDNEETYQSPIFPFWNVAYKHTGEFWGLLNVVPLNMFTFRVTPREGEDNVVSFHIPYLYFYWELQYNKINDDYAKTGLSVYVSYESPSPQTVLSIPNLNNVHRGGTLCLGSVDIPSLYKDFTEIKKAQDGWLSAKRNYDLVDWARLRAEKGRVFGNSTLWAKSGIIYEARYKTIQELITQD
jgi:hypothetical protein